MGPRQESRATDYKEVALNTFINGLQFYLLRNVLAEAPVCLRSRSIITWLQDLVTLQPLISLPMIEAFMPKATAAL